MIMIMIGINYQFWENILSQHDPPCPVLPTVYGPSCDQWVFLTSARIKEYLESEACDSWLDMPLFPLL